jgi:hypothetical protein
MIHFLINSLSKYPDESYPGFLHDTFTDDGTFFLDVVNSPRHEQPCIFHWKDAQRFFDFNSGQIMPDSGSGLWKGCDAISSPGSRYRM